jgi:UDP-N-acetylmuramate: L-alanyl-gamma-D-glutamyl-meso-diaminopimelate ligase
LYPHIAIITGIGWDHINVFPTLILPSAIQIFIDKIEHGGI